MSEEPRKILPYSPNPTPGKTENSSASRIRRRLAFSSSMSIIRVTAADLRKQRESTRLPTNIDPTGRKR